MDVLSEVLKTVKLDGAVFFNGEFSSPWCTREPDSHTMESFFPSGPKHVFIFHLVTEGRGYVRLKEGGRAEPLQAGDVVIADCALRDEGTSYHYLPPGREYRILFMQREIAEVLAAIPEIEVMPNPPHTNMMHVFIRGEADRLETLELQVDLGVVHVQPQQRGPAAPAPTRLPEGSGHE